MAKNNASNQDYTNNADGWDLSGGSTKRKLTVTGADIILTGSGSNTYTYPAASDTLVGRASTDTLTNKTLTEPKFADLGFIADANGNELIVMDTVASAVPYIRATNAATGGVVGFIADGETNQHIQMIGKGNGLTKISVLRQDNTSNSYKHNAVILTGYGVYATGAAASKTETVTFGITFAAVPIVVACAGGDDTAGSTTYGEGKGEDQNFHTHAHTITTTSFVAQSRALANWASGTTVFYQWIAIGELA